jgi:hypothetical protein
MEVIKRKGSNRCGWIVSACVERERMGLEGEREGGREREGEDKNRKAK